MAGRGRGRGQAVSFNTDQFGFGRGDQPQTLTAPPPIFPLLENRPIPLTKGGDQTYELVVQKAIVTMIAESPFYLKPTADRKQFSEKIVMFEAHKREQELQDKILWNRLPLELRKKVSTSKRSTSDKSSKLAKKKRLADPDKILAKYEEKEKHDSDEEDKDDTKGDESDEEEQVLGDEDQEIEQDDEMDEGNDYNLGYFDNGEDYLPKEENDDDNEPTF